MRIGSIVIHCNNFEAMMRFWEGALRYEPREPPTGGRVVLHDPGGPPGLAA